MDHEKGDFSAEFRLLWIAALAIAVGAICALVAVLLSWLIAFFTNVFYYHELSIVIRSPAAFADGTPHPLGASAIFAPVVGGLIIGLMARYGSERIRGHGIPEAMEAILIGQSRMQPKVAVLKPVSSAISIGSGGPFGAEGPIIMTGGAVGSIIAQMFRMSSVERKTLLVAGAAGGMSATFNAPVAALLLAVELLLFEWKPRSLVPVALASTVAALLRPFFLHETGPIWGVEAHGVLPAEAFLSAAVVGLTGGALSMLLTAAVYGAEDAFKRLPIHWMWWPALGGLAVGVGGYFEPRALGVGYDIIQDLLGGNHVPQTMLALIVVKGFIWSIALGSGTSGGVLAPLLIMGGALGALESTFLPGGDARLWPLVGLAAILGGTLRAPLTGVLFALELTHDVGALPALLIGSVTSYACSVLWMKRSILTEKVARRGYHISGEYAVDPLEWVAVGDVMTRQFTAVRASMSLKELVEGHFLAEAARSSQGYPVVDDAGHLVGMITKANLLDHWVTSWVRGGGDLTLQVAPIIAFDLLERDPITIHVSDSCRAAAERMAREGVGRLLVVDTKSPRELLGIVTRADLLKPRARCVADAEFRERFIEPRLARRRVANPQSVSTGTDGDASS
ncbi:MAG TPA: chloride channel protein [Pirellulales bacterium]|nr:chloride channel protein [Pirellulales bacterium]